MDVQHQWIFTLQNVNYKCHRVWDRFEGLSPEDLYVVMPDGSWETPRGGRASALNFPQVGMFVAFHDVHLSPFAFDGNKADQCLANTIAHEALHLAMFTLRPEEVGGLWRMGAYRTEAIPHPVAFVIHVLQCKDPLMLNIHCTAKCTCTSGTLHDIRDCRAHGVTQLRLLTA